MSFFTRRNPTKLGVDAVGRLAGDNYRVVGRIAMTNSAGFRWQEYHLRKNGGGSRLLVYEAGEWKLFQLFEPTKAVPLEDLPLARDGGLLRLNGEPLHVEYVESSKVLYVEGEAPEGYVTGAESRYINGRLGDHMIVISWKGPEVEYYRGRNLAEFQVRHAFSLPAPNLWRRAVEAFQMSNWSLAQVFWAVFVCLILALRFADFIPDSPTYSAPSPTVTASSPGLAPGQRGELDHLSYQIEAHALVEVRRPGQTFVRNEYTLVDPSGATALLVQGLDAKSEDWLLLTPESSLAGVSPLTFARWTKGKMPSGQPKQGNVLYLFQSVARTIDGARTEDPWRGPGTVEYGFLATTGKDYLFVRWTEERAMHYTGTRLASNVVAQAFGVRASH